MGIGKGIYIVKLGRVQFEVPVIPTTPMSIDFDADKLIAS